MAEIAYLVDINLGNGARITNLPTPLNEGDAVPKSYVDGVGGYVIKSASYACATTDKTIESTSPGITITLNDSIAVGQPVVSINASGGSISITSSTSKEIGNLPSNNPTVWTQPANSSYSFVYNGSRWRFYN